MTRKKSFTFSLKLPQFVFFLYSTFLSQFATFLLQIIIKASSMVDHGRRKIADLNTWWFVKRVRGSTHTKKKKKKGVNHFRVSRVRRTWSAKKAVRVKVYKRICFGWAWKQWETFFHSLSRSAHFFEEKWLGLARRKNFWLGEMCATDSYTNFLLSQRLSHSVVLLQHLLGTLVTTSWPKSDIINQLLLPSNFRHQYISKYGPILFHRLNLNGCNCRHSVALVIVSASPEIDISFLCRTACIVIG